MSGRTPSLPPECQYSAIVAGKAVGQRLGRFGRVGIRVGLEPDPRVRGEVGAARLAGICREQLMGGLKLCVSARWPRVRFARQTRVLSAATAPAVKVCTIFSWLPFAVVTPIVRSWRGGTATFRIALAAANATGAKLHVAGGDGQGGEAQGEYVLHGKIPPILNSGTDFRQISRAKAWRAPCLTTAGWQAGLGSNSGDHPIHAGAGKQNRMGPLSGDGSSAQETGRAA